MMETQHELEPKKPLNTKAVYLAAIGVFESSGFNLVGVCFHLAYDYIQEESVRVYEKDGKYHLLYFPGKDHQKQVDLVQKTLPLSTIINNGNQSLLHGEAGIHGLPVHAPLLDAQQLENARKHYIVCENQAGAEHYIYAQVSGKNLATVDSIDSLFRNYDESGIVASICGNEPLEHKSIKRGGQNVLNNWECGYFVTMELYNALHSQEGFLALGLMEEDIRRVRQFHGLGQISYIQQQFSIAGETASDSDKKASSLVHNLGTDPDIHEWDVMLPESGIFPDDSLDAKIEIIDTKAPLSEKSFFEAHPRAKWALWGAIVVLSLVLTATVIGLVIATSGIAVPFIGALTAFIAGLSTGWGIAAAVGIPLGIAVLGAALGYLSACMRECVSGDEPLSDPAFQGVIVKPDVRHDRDAEIYASVVKPQEFRKSGQRFFPEVSEHSQDKRLSEKNLRSAEITSDVASNSDEIRIGFSKTS